MARNANVYGEIADYLETIQTTFIWPALVSKDGKKPGPRTDSLVTFSRLMMSTHAKGSLMLDRGCVTNNDCDQDEECVKGVCMPAGTTTSSFAGSGCRTNNDCDQDEECVDGICTPILGGGFEPAAVANVPFYDGRVKEAFESYFGRIHLVLTKVLAEDPRKLPGVREVLMELYAGAAGTVGSKLPECTRAGDCPDGSACVGGHCVPVPFRLVLKLSPFRAPWK
jgi:hypothetical protein